MKKIISGMLALTMLFGGGALLPEGITTESLSIVASAKTLSGKVDDTINWSYDGKGKLTLSGTMILRGYDEDCTLFTDVKAKDVTEIVIENGITQIKDCYFLNEFVNAKKISIADSVEFIGSDYSGMPYFNPFSETKWFKNAKKKNDLVILDGFLLDATAASGNVVVPDGVKMICYGAFRCEGTYNEKKDTYEYDSKIKSITLPDDLKIIGDFAFSGCGKLTKINIPESVESIGLYAFRDTKILNSITTKAKYIDKWLIEYNIRENRSNLNIKKGTVGIASHAVGFYDNNGDAWTSLREGGWTLGPKKVTLPDSLKYINIGAFIGCNRLEEIKIPKGVTLIDTYAFCDCIKLKSVSIPNTVTEIGNYAFESCYALKKITIPSSVKVIGAWAFANCKSLKKVKLNEGLQTVGAAAFKLDTKLKSVVVPKSVKKIFEYAFGCDYDGGGWVDNKDGGSSWVDGKGEIHVKNFTLYCYYGSAAAKHAKKEKLNYQYVIGLSNIKGVKNTVYTGKAIKPTVSVKLGKNVLKEGTDYTVSFENNKKIGTAKVIITGIGDYADSGKVTKTFKITPKATKVKSAASPKAGQLKVKAKKVSGVTGYQIKYSTSKKFTKKTTKTVNVKKTSKTFTSLKKGKKYYVKVRAYKTVNGKKYYSKFSAVKSVTVKK
ncbi:MAG: leucine-rich repeat domain-containing protein [Ruminococcus sp.]|nr:leucine-rich repeat domain-containing protein [Ruminococcus sp.]